MPDLKFEKCGINEQGDSIYRLVMAGRIVRDGLTIDQVIEVINRRDEESLGEEHGTKRRADEGIGPCKRRRDDGA